MLGTYTEIEQEELKQYLDDIYWSQYDLMKFILQYLKN